MYSAQEGGREGGGRYGRGTWFYQPMVEPPEKVCWLLQWWITVSVAFKSPALPSLGDAQSPPQAAWAAAAAATAAGAEAER